MFLRRLQRFPVSHVSLHDPFWGTWQDTVSRVTIPSQHALLESTGRLENLRKAARGEAGFVGYRFNDSDVYKWIEACAFSLMQRPSLDNRKRMDDVVEIVAAAQMSDGYLNSYFQTDHPAMRWRNLSMMHEMYCGGHLIEAAVAHHEATGTRTLLDVAIRWTDHVMSIFGPGKRVGCCGHEEMELALLKLADATGDKKYREYARWQMEIRGQRPSFFAAEFDDQEAHDLSPLGMALLKRDGVYSGDYLQDHAPIREHDAVVGHAVRAMYLYIAATQLSEEDPTLDAAMLRCWESLVKRRMYITGGIGPSGDNEGFTRDFDLPNHTAYAETCAAIGLVLWGHRLFERTGDASFMDVAERALYNGALAGISLSGDRYFYANPLESRADHERDPWFGCACCPPNIARLIGQVGQLAVGQSADGVWITMPIGVEVASHFGTIRIDGTYPWLGTFQIQVKNPVSDPFAIRIRIPDWCPDATFHTPDETPAEYEDGFAVIRRGWKDGDVVRVEFEMPPTWMEAHPEVLDDAGKVALTVGPLVYAAESTKDSIPQRFRVDLDAEPVLGHQPSPLGKVPVIEVEGVADQLDFVDALYAPAGEKSSLATRIALTPYFMWNNAGKAHMAVWLRAQDG